MAWRPDEGESHDDPGYGIYHRAQRPVRTNVKVDPILDPGSAASRSEGVGVVEARQRSG